MSIDLPISKENILSEIKDSNPFYAIIVGSEIAMRYSVKYLRGVSAPDKPYLAIESLNSVKPKIFEDSEVDDQVYGLFASFSKRILNEGDIVMDYGQEDLYQSKTSTIELLSKNDDDYSEESDDDDEYGDNTYYEEDDEDDDDSVDNDDGDDDEYISEDDLDEI